MKLPKVSYDPISKLIDLLVDAGIDKIKEKADRSAKVIAIRKYLNLGAEKPLADDFDGVYAFTLAEYYKGNYPKEILEFFGDAIIKEYFQKSFEQRNFGILEDETENFLDWNFLGKRFEKLDIQPQAHFEGFQQLFYEAIELTKRPIDFVHQQRDDDLGADIASLRDEVQEIKEGKEQVLPPPFNLPSIDISKFTGREEELKKLEELIFNQEGSRVVGIVGLTGTGGMGKSALAVKFAHIYKDRFPDGIIGMRVDRATTDEIARSFALQVVTKVDPELKANQIMQRHFQNRRALLILDNVEDATARELEPGADKCAVIITTRNRNLNLGTTGQIDLNRFSPTETHDLLVSFPGKERVSEEPDAVQRIHELVGGLPLAIRIVGGALVDEKESTLSEFADRLESERNRLYLNDPEDESLDVHASINVSLRKLDETQIYLYSCLSVCAPEGFSSETVKAISQRETDIVKTNLARLVKLSLLDFTEEKKRYFLHPLLFDASTELAKGNNKEIKSNDIYADLLSRHSTYFRDFARQHKGYRANSLNAIEKEFDELFLTAKRLIELKIPDYGYYLALEAFFQARGYWVKAFELIDAYLKLAKEIDDSAATVQFLIQRGQFLQLAGKIQGAERAFSDAIENIEKVENKNEQDHLRALALNSLGGVFQKQGNFKKAVDTLNRSYELLLKLNDESGQAKALNSLGIALQQQGNFNDAAKALQKSADIEEKLGNKRGQAMALTSLGGILQRQGNFVKAIDAFQRSVIIEQDLGNEYGQAKALNSLGGTVQRQGKFDDAFKAFQKSYSLLKKLGDEAGQAKVLTSLGGVLQRQGKFDEAIDTLQKSAVIEEKLGNKVGQAKVLTSLGGVLQRQGKFDEAIDALQKSAVIEEKLGNKVGLAKVLNSLGGVLQRQGKFDEAVDALRKSCEIAKRQGDENSLAMRLNSLGGVLQRQGKFDEALDAIQKSVEIGEKQEDWLHVAMALNSLGRVLQQQSKFDEAVVKLKQALVISERLNSEITLAMIHFNMGKMHLEQNNFEEARSHLTISFEINEKLKIAQGMRIVTPSQVRVLSALGRHNEAKDYAQRALTIVPNDKRLLRLTEQLSENKQGSSNTTKKLGRIKKTIRNLAGYLYGFIVPDDGSTDIYFGQDQVDERVIPKLAEGLSVWAEVEVAARGPRAKRVWLKE